MINFNDIFNALRGKLTSWLHELFLMLPNILLAAVILVLGVFVARYIKKMAAKLAQKISPNNTLNHLFTSIIHIFFIGIVLFTALSVLKLDKAVTSILAGAGIIGLALAFAFQDIAANFISGIFISIRKPINLGDVVKIKDYMGSVEEINLRDTILRTFQGQMVIIPNKEVFQNPIENFTLLGKRRLDMPIGVSYSDDLEKVKTVAIEAVKDIEGLYKDDEITVFFNQFGDSSINFILRLWIDTANQANFLAIESQAIINIKKAFDQNGISIPFPIRTLDVSAGMAEALKR